MRARGEGWIVNVSSFAGKLGQPDEAAYSASKFAVTGLSEALAAEFAPLGIHVLCVHPVLVRTEMFTPEVLARMPQSTLRQFIEPGDFAERTLRALARGETDAVIPRRFGWVPVLRSLFPRLVGAGVARVKLASLPDVTK
jgi:short-subunit dehydrogenase